MVEFWKSSSSLYGWIPASKLLIVKWTQQYLVGSQNSLKHVDWSVATVNKNYVQHANCPLFRKEVAPGEGKFWFFSKYILFLTTLIQRLRVRKKDNSSLVNLN